MLSTEPGAGQLQGSTAILYDGSPSYPGPDVLWKIAADAGATCLGASPSYVQVMEKAGIVSRKLYDLSRLRQIFLTGSPATPEMCDWFYLMPCPTRRAQSRSRGGASPPARHRSLRGRRCRARNRTADSMQAARSGKTSSPRRSAA